MSRMRLALLLAVLPIVSTGQSGDRVVRPEIRIGDSWTYRSTNAPAPGAHEYENRVSFVDDKLILIVATRKGDGKEFDSSYTLEWNAVTVFTGRMYRPNNGIFRFPLRVGDEYDYRFDLVQPRSTTVVNLTAGKAKVTGWEEIEVPAGKFRALKLEMQSETKSPDGSNFYRQNGVFWYVPEVRRWVKYQFVFPNITVGEELLRFKLNED